MKRYFKLYLAFVRNCVVREMEFKAHFIAWVLVNVSWLAFTLIFFKILYLNTQTIAGWKPDEMIVFLGVVYILEFFVWTVLYPNMASLPRYINRGELDFILMKPVDAQFFVSARRVSPHNMFSLVIALILLGVGIKQTGLTITLIKTIPFLVLIFGATLACYSVWFMTVTTAFWFGRLGNVQEVFASIWQFARFPREVFKGALRFLLTFVFPVAVATTFPAKLIMGRLDFISALFLLLFSFLLLFASRLFWHLALKRYSSAGG